jgi:hypothetical protein
VRGLLDAARAGAAPGGVRKKNITVYAYYPYINRSEAKPAFNTKSGMA